MSYDGEHCQECGMPVAFFLGGTWWTAQGQLWLDVHDGEVGVLCPPCFTRAARAKGIALHFEAVRGV